MNVMIIYDEWDRAARAINMLKGASNRAEEAVHWSIKPWRLDLLNVFPLGEEALRQAASAHLIVFAVQSRAHLAPALLDWLGTWAARRQVQDGSLAVFDGDSGGSLSVTASLELSQFAERHGLSFILGDVHLAEDESAAFVQAGSRGKDHWGSVRDCRVGWFHLAVRESLT